MKVVMSIGGSVLVPEEVDISYVRYLAEFIRELSGKHKIAIVTGGGRLARKYIEPARKSGASETTCDFIGIEATRLNARFLAAVIGKKAASELPADLAEAAAMLDAGKVVVMGGTYPAHSTDAVAAMLAEYIGADLLINASNVEGIYDRDPNKDKKAKMYDRIRVSKLLDMVASFPAGAGKYELVDVLAAKVIQRSKIKTVFLNGRNLENMRAAIEKKKFKGTIIEAG